MTALGRTSEAGCAPGPVPSFFVDELLVLCSQSLFPSLPTYVRHGARKELE